MSPSTIEAFKQAALSPLPSVGWKVATTLWNLASPSFPYIGATIAIASALFVLFRHLTRGKQKSKS